MSWFDNIDFDDRFLLPIRINNDSDYEKGLIRVLDDFIGKLRNIHVPQDVISDVTYIKNKIVTSINFYYKGDIPKAITQISSILDKFQKKEVIISYLNQSFGLNGFLYYLIPEKDMFIDINKLYFYKARISRKIEDYSANDMIHIPFNLREKVASQRFSIPGLPCVYLGTSSYVCWLELDRPIRANFNASAIELNSEFKILNLISTWDMISRLSKKEEWDFSLNKEKIIRELLVMWPLVCATSFKVKYCDDRSFKSEYVISQLLMQVVVSKGIDGICYHSKRIYDNYAYPHCINLALPAKFNGEDLLSENIKNWMQVKKPVNFEEYSLLKRSVKSPIINTELPDSVGIDAILAGVALNYSGTEFYDFDRYLRYYPDNN